MKYFLLFVVVIVVLMLHKKNRASRQAMQERPKTQRLSAPEPMHACTRCGVNVPASRCVWDAQQRPYCCAEHARQG
ncbi:PP0621 family protein [Thiomonas sp.]|jgi:uncharacterized protein|uniref:PP0621 family protein n=1 Tax=Thiomonas sp. TaxID=2047785 RepID=UPI002613D92E|nr:PP0621 family protein [Thiomonas sp.]